MKTEPRDIRKAPLSAESTSSFVDVAGVRMHYVHAGAGRPLLLLHGLVGSVTNWRHNISAFGRHASVYAFDMANMGKSQRVAGVDVGLAATADRIIAAMDVLGLAQADIAGHSHGGAIALMLAARHPERVRSLILFAPANPFCNRANRLVRIYSTAMGARLARLAPFFPSALQRIALRRMWGDPKRIPEGTLEGYVEGLRVPGTVPHVLAIVRRWFSEMQLLGQELPHMPSVPTLLLWGDRDRAVGLRSAERLVEALPNARLVVFPGAGHVVFEELPEEANRAIISWLKRDLEALPATPVPEYRQEPRTSPRRVPPSAGVPHLSRGA